ncbi:MAG: aspartate/glutamate racemase family protein [Ardenticatenaceae bacterium]|nr:aspartate/glutamate racemase family protein [Ardenticatenaceae bacterium]HBY98160.1 Asp/Glu/hydantoin racemase [Chloroflexota bacterium]
MARTLALIHTVSSLAPVFTTLWKEAMPDVKVFNIVDESLINNTIAANRLTPTTARRLARYIESAEEGGADAVMVTCSSVGPAVEAARPFVNIPVMRVDQPMADLAVAMGRRIGVIATLATTLEPTTELVRASAAAHGREVDVIPYLCEGAFQAVVAGDTETHDRIVTAGLKELMRKVDVIVLAQASMARVVDALSEEEKRVALLSSPRLGVEGAKKMIDELR